MYLLLIVILGLSACKKEAGDGGLATIEGNVYHNLYTPLGDFLEQTPAGNENIYIIYGDNDTYDDRADTDANGKYQFKSMQKGDYRIYAFSDCNTCASGVNEEEVAVSVTDKKGTAIAGDLVLTKNIDYNDGSSSIKGKVYETMYINTVAYQWGYQVDINVYIYYDNDVAYFDKVQTNGSGEYQFFELLKGNYTVSAYSDVNIITVEKVELFSEITANGQSITLADLYVSKHK